MPHHIVIVEDEPVTQARLQSYFTQEGYTVSVTASGAGLREIMQNQPVDLILLDINLPDENGLMLTRALRERSTVGIILVTGRSDRIDRIVGLEMGADDYIVKPFGVKEVCARVRAVLRRTENQVAPQQEEKIKGGDITVDIVSHTVTKGDKSIELTAKEFDLLVMLMRNSGRVLTRDTLLDRVWGVEYFGDTRTVDVHVRYLRQKIEDNPDTPQLLQTVRGVGYKFVGE